MPRNTTAARKSQPPDRAYESTVWTPSERVCFRARVAIAGRRGQAESHKWDAGENAFEMRWSQVSGVSVPDAGSDVRGRPAGGTRLPHGSGVLPMRMQSTQKTFDAESGAWTRFETSGKGFWHGWHAWCFKPFAVRHHRSFAECRIAESRNVFRLLPHIHWRIVMRNAIHSLMLAAVGLLQVAIFASFFLGR